MIKIYGQYLGDRVEELDDENDRVDQANAHRSGYSIVGQHCCMEGVYQPIM